MKATPPNPTFACPKCGHQYDIVRDCGISLDKLVSGFHIDIRCNALLDGELHSIPCDHTFSLLLSTRQEVQPRSLWQRLLRRPPTITEHPTVGYGDV